MQLYRACLETIGLVPSDAIVSAAAQIEWLWYVTPFKGFYRDHLAHVMKVALTGLWLLEEKGSPLATGGNALINQVAKGLATGEFGSDAIRGAARWCRVSEKDLEDPAFWKAAVLESVRIAGLLHDMAYPDTMSASVDDAAKGVRVRSPRQDSEAELARWAVNGLNDHLVMAPFHEGQLPWWRSMSDDSRRVAEILFQQSHSLRGAHSLLQFMGLTHRIAPLDPFERFVLEWAALAISLHDYDKLFELRGKRCPEGSKPWEQQRWAEKPENRCVIRPCFKGDPVSSSLPATRRSRRSTSSCG
jgi:hypothetical protein